VKRNTFSKALKHLKSTELDEKIQRLNEAPTNSMSGVYALNDPGFRLNDPDPERVFYPDVDGNWPAGIPGTPGADKYTRPAGFWSGGTDWDTIHVSDLSQAYLDLNATGTSTSSLIEADGTVKTPLPPNSRNFILGPLVDGYVRNHGYDDFTNIGYLQKDTRQFVLLASVPGHWDSNLRPSGFAPRQWDGSTITIYNANFTLAMATWFSDKITSNNYTANVPYFSPGGIPQIPQSPADCPKCPPGMKGGNGAGGAGAGWGSGGNSNQGSKQGEGKKGNAGDANLWGYNNKTGKKEKLSAKDYAAYKAGGGDAAAKKGKSIEQIVAQGKKNLGQYDSTPNIGTLGQLGARLLRSFTDSSRFAGDFMFKGLPKGTPYLPDFTGAAQKGLAAWLTGGKKWGDVFGDLGRTLAGKNYASQYFTPSLNKALDYAKAGGTVVVMPRTPGVQGFKNWFGSSVSRGFGLGDIEKLVRTSDTIKSFNQGTTQIFDRADPKQMVELQKLATQGAKTNTMMGKLGRAVPFVGAAAAIADVGTRLSKGDYAGAALGGISAIPGPIGWVGLGAQVFYDNKGFESLATSIYAASQVPTYSGPRNVRGGGQIKENVLIEQKEDEYLNNMRQALFELGSPTNRKEYAIQQGTLLTLMGVNPELVSIITIAAAGEEFSPEQKQWIENNLIPMIEIFSALRENQKDIKIQESILLPESHKRILREIKQPVKVEEQKPQKLKKYRPNFAGRYTAQNTPDVTASPKSDEIVKAKNAAGQTWRTMDKHWSRYESTERMNIVYDNVGHGSQYWDQIVNENQMKKVMRDREIQEHLNIIAHEKAMLREDPLYQSPFKKPIQEQETLQADKDPLFKKVKDKLKLVIDYPDKPSKLGYPDQPPPEMVNGMHPEYGQKADYYNALDPHSANAMPSTGNPEIDAKVRRAKTLKKVLGKKA